MKKFFIWRGLSTQVVLWVILPISLVLTLISFGSLSLHRDAMRTMVGERDRRTVRSASSALREELNHRTAAIQGLAIRLQDDVSPEEVLASATFVIPDFDIGLYFYSPAGELLDISGDEILWASIEGDILSSLSQYLSLDAPQTYFSEPFPHPIYDNYICLVIYQTEPGVPLAVGAFSITNLARQTLAGTSSYEDGTTILLTDSAGRLLYLNGKNPLHTEPLAHPGVFEALHGESGTTYITANNTEHVIAFNPVAPTGWALIIEEPWDSVTSPMLRYTELGPVVLLPMILFALVALWLSARQIIQPLTQLEEQAAALEWGDYQAVMDDVGGIEEIQSLQRTLVHMADRIRLSQQGLRDYIGVITKTQEEERKRLARELHDETLQSIIALNQRIQLLRQHVQAPKAIAAVAETETMIGETIRELRRFTRALRPLYLEDLGMVPALEMLAQETQQLSGLDIHFNKVGDEKRLSEAVEIAIYRIAQEGLSNVIRHAKASSVEMILKFSEEAVEFIVSDDGIGFDVPASPSDLAPAGHYGLLGIYERADLLGAACTIDAVAGEGTRITIRVLNN